MSKTNELPEQSVQTLIHASICLLFKKEPDLLYYLNKVVKYKNCLRLKHFSTHLWTALK